jgi:hypothetical protein
LEYCYLLKLIVRSIAVAAVFLHFETMTTLPTLWVR